MTATTILLLDALRGHRRTGSLAPALEQHGYAVTRINSLQAATKHAGSLYLDLVIVDAVSLKTSGARICRQLQASLNGTPILLITDQHHTPGSSGCEMTTLAPPFTPRKLLNRVARLLPAKDESAFLQAGPIRLYPAQRRVVCASRQAQLTPKQAKLLAMLLRAPGQLITREAIMKQVWQTDYLGDTRTLDVHVSWLRSVIEPDPRKPRYLKTVRGVGYRLDVA